MAIELTIPSAGESITEVQIGKWRKSEGDRVESDEVIVEIETDKAAMELPAPASGILERILMPEGADVGIGAVIAVIAEVAGSNERANGGESTSAPPDRSAEASKAPATQEPPAAVTSEPEPRVMPSAKRVLGQAGVPESTARGSGPGGRVLKEDAVRAVVEAKHKPPAPPKSDPPKPRVPQPSAAVPPSVPSRSEETVPMSPLRKAVARNLVSVQQNAALLTTFNEIDMSAVKGLRSKYRDEFLAAHGVKLGFMSFFVKAVVAALKVVPGVNARIDGTNIIYRNYHDIGIAVGGGRGLVVPVLRNADSLSFADIEKAIGDFVVRAGENKLELNELQGGTFTISNGGIYGSMLSTPIVNPPQSGILGMHAIKDRAVVVDGSIVARPMMYVALTYDHRIVDGREAVTFLRTVKDAVESPERIWLEI